MGLWRWPNLLLVVCACYLALIYEAVPAAWVNHGNKELGNLEIIFYTKGRIIPQEPAGLGHIRRRAHNVPGLHGKLLDLRLDLHL